MGLLGSWDGCVVIVLLNDSCVRLCWVVGEWLEISNFAKERRNIRINTTFAFRRPFLLETEKQDLQYSYERVLQ